MVEMTREERKVANFLKEKNFRYKFQPSVSVKDMGNRERLFYPDFYLTELNIYIEVCGAERNEDYERRDKIYKKEEIPIIFVETYKGEDKWKHYLLRRIEEIQEKRQSAISTIKPIPQPVQSETKEVKPEPIPTPEYLTKEIANHIDKLNAENNNVVNNSQEDNTSANTQENNNYNLISQQTKIGIMVTLIGLLFIVISVITFSVNVTISMVFIIVGLILFFVGFYIVFFRFSRWFRDWRRMVKEKFNNWLDR